MLPKEEPEFPNKEDPVLAAGVEPNAFVVLPNVFPLVVLPKRPPLATVLAPVLPNKLPPPNVLVLKWQSLNKQL